MQGRDAHVDSQKPGVMGIEGVVEQSSLRGMALKSSGFDGWLKQKHPMVAEGTG